MSNQWQRADWLIFVLGGLNLGVGIALLASGDPTAAVSFLVLAWTFYLIPRMMRSARRVGWYTGRMTMLHSIDEAMSRGMSYADWLLAEAEREFEENT